MSMSGTVMASEARVEGLTLSRGGRVLVRDLSFTLQPGEALVLTGSNGSGKTTLLRALAGLVRPDAGAIDVPKVNYLGHADGLKGSETVLDALQFWSRLAGDAQSGTIASVADALDLRALLLTRCQHLSAGQKRRTALARLMLSGPCGLWLMDEPAAPLDTRSRGLLAGLAAQFRAEGGMIIAATHAELGWPDVRTLDMGSGETSL